MKKRKSFFGAVTTASVLAALLPMVLSTGLLTGCKPKIEPDYGYKVEHWQQNAENDEYAKVDEESLKGKEGKMTSAKAKTYEGFTAQGFSQAAIRADGSTVVRINYNRNIITLTLDLQGGKIGEETGTKVLKGKFGANIGPVEPTKAEHIFWYWEPELPSTFPAQNTEYKAFWNKNFHITIKGDERTEISQENFIEIPITETKKWADIKAQVEAKVNLKPEWQGRDYEVYEWRLGGEAGTKLGDVEPINKHFTVYAVTNYNKFNIDSTGTKIILIDNKGYSGAKPKGRIIIPDRITEIEDNTFASSGAFSRCTKISSVKFPKSLTQIGKNTFSDCTGLTSIDLPEGLTQIGESAFSRCTGLTSINLPEGLTEIGTYAFSRCTGLTSIDLPKGLTQIGDGPFLGCTGLTSLKVAAANTAYKAENNILYTKNGMTLVCAAGGLTSATIPDRVTAIGREAFSDCTGLTSIDLPKGLTQIGTYAFSRCTGLTSIDLPEGLTQIGTYAFSRCTGLTSITLPESLTTIDEWAFYGCTGLTSITLPESLTTIDEWAFSGCENLTSATFADKNGWAVYGNYDYETHEYTDKIKDIDKTELENAAKAAEYLCDTYCGKYWKKN